MGGVELVHLQRIDDSRGVISVATAGRELKFAPQRFFIIDNPFPVPRSRGRHAHRRQAQFLISMTGSSFISARTATGEADGIHLAGCAVGVYVPPMHWLDVEINPYSRLMVLSSGAYDEGDYIRDWDKFAGEAAA